MEQLTLSTWQYDIVTCFLIFLGRFLSNNLSDIRGFIHACLSALVFCFCSRFFWSFSSIESSVRLARAAFATDNNRLLRSVARAQYVTVATTATVVVAISGIGSCFHHNWILKSAADYYSRSSISPKCKRALQVFFWACVVGFTASFLIASHNTRTIDFDGAFGPRKVQYWTYKLSKTKSRYVYDNTPSLFDQRRVEGVIDDNVRQQLGTEVKKIGFSLKQQRVVEVRTKKSCPVGHDILICKVHVLEKSGTLGSLECDGTDHRRMLERPRWYCTESEVMALPKLRL